MAKRAVLRVVPIGQDPTRLPASPAALSTPNGSGPLFTGIVVVAGVVLVGFPIVEVAVRVVNRDPVSSVLLSLIVPGIALLVLIPVLIIFATRRRRELTRLHTGYPHQVAAAVPIPGTVVSAPTTGNQGNGVLSYPVTVRTAGADVITTALAPTSSGVLLTRRELPAVGDPAWVWRLSSGWTVVQTMQRTYSAL